MSEQVHLDLDRYVPALLTFIANKLASSASQEYRKRFGVGVVEWRMLSMLAVENGITANRISQVIGLDKGAVSRALHQLAGTGHVVFAADSTDARRQIVSLTPAGWALHDQIIRVALQREQILLDGLSSRDVDTLIRLLHHLHGRVEHLTALEME